MENLATGRISILILAGGTSSRMGRDKALIPINGVVMLERICLVATECSNSVQVVTPWPERYQHIVPHHCGFLPELGGEGPLVAFAQSLPLVETEWVLLLACDLPLLLGKDIREWIGYLEVVKEEVVAVLPKSEKGWEPLCGFYRRRCLPNLTDFIAQGGRSFQSWLKLHPVGELPTLGVRR
ncbi:MAG: molybdenum cofactor guanylyltransferase [Prochloron sp. SP5CPC1]|nr:molybdenum cofactor guanylyltransferase [Candidatus Paraprochloron terpiosi SP5CPC1]